MRRNRAVRSAVRCDAAVQCGVAAACRSPPGDQRASPCNGVLLLRAGHLLVTSVCRRSPATSAAAVPELRLLQLATRRSQPVTETRRHMDIECPCCGRYCSDRQPAPTSRTGVVTIPALLSPPSEPSAQLKTPTGQLQNHSQADHPRIFRSAFCPPSPFASSSFCKRCIPAGCARYVISACSATWFFSSIVTTSRRRKRVVAQSGIIAKLRGSQPLSPDDRAAALYLLQLHFRNLPKIGIIRYFHPVRRGDCD